jgi:hypothetical protein
MSWEPDYKAMYVDDAMRFLKWILKRKGEPARIDVTPINFNSAHWMGHNRPEGGPLMDSQQAEGYNTFVWTVTEAGFIFMRENGWTGNEMENIPLDPAKEVRDELLVLTSILKLDLKRRIHEITLLEAPEVVRDKLADGSNKVMIFGGELYAVSFEELIGFNADLLFEEV